MSATSGDFRRLQELSAEMRSLSKSGRRDALKLFGASLMRRTDLCFQGSRSPYGERWAPLKNPSKKRRGGMVLLDTGRLRNSVTSKTRATSGSVSVSSNVVYAGIHNYGGSTSHAGRYQPRSLRGNRFISRKEAGKKSKASHRRLGVAKSRVSFLGAHDVAIPKRQFLPDKRRGLPAVYVLDLRNAARAIMTSTMRKGGGK